MPTKSVIKYEENMRFDVEVNGHHFKIDADEKVGGKDAGPRPKPLLLAALGGCTGMDVVSILRKMRVEDFDFNLEVEGESTTEHPKHYKKITVNYIFKGEALPEKKIKKAVNLSETRYCGVSEMLGKAAKLDTKIIINGKEVDND
mgnify:CR=1 FL=1